MKFKKMLVAFLTTTVMGTSMMSMGASAYSDTYSLHYASGASSSDNVTSKSWTYYTSKTTQTIKVSSFTRTGTSAYLKCYNGMGIYTGITSTGTLVTTCKTGCKTTVYTKLVNYTSSGIRATGSISG